ncbi:MAG TPA: TetR/AcrR family transcriptional regulator [Candidatus Dormibacteraeota bacterium]|nr:TetR/AcrR family transcriptional regulator [Candidatus Dormibacteraeota bacterium]
MRRELLDQELSPAKQLLLRSTYRLISERGVHRVSLEDIAQLAGVSKGLVLYHFKTKERLVLATMRWALAATADRIRSAMAAAHSPEAKVVAMIDAIWVGPDTNRAFYLTYVDLAAQAARNATFTELSETFHTIVDALYADAVREGVDAGAFAVDGIDEAAMVVRAIIDGLFIQWMQDRTWKRRHATYREVCKRAVLAYLARPAGTPA